MGRFVIHKCLITKIIFVSWAPAPLADFQLSFGVYATDKPTVVVKKFKPMVRALERALTKNLGQPVDVKMQVASTYEKGIEAIAWGRVDFARLGPASYVQVKHKAPGVQILAIESIKGKKEFKGVICASQAAPVQKVFDLKGKRFAFGDPNSTIGRYLAQQHLMGQGVRAGDLAHYEYLGRHDRVGHAVGAGQFDAGALKESTYKRLVKQGVPLRLIAEFPNVTKPWISRSDLDERVVGALRESLLTIREPRALKALKKDGFLPGHDSDYALVRTAINNNTLFFQ